MTDYDLPDPVDWRDWVDITRKRERENAPDWKPAARVKASPAEWTGLHEMFDGVLCRVCGVAYKESLHHLVKRSQGGDDVFGNLVPVCGDGTRGCHGLLERRDPEALAVLRSMLTWANHEYLAAKLGGRKQAWLDRNLPHLPEAA